MEENVAVNGAAITSCLKKKTVKRFVHCHIFAQSLPGRQLNDKYPVNTSHHSWLVLKGFLRSIIW